jgi:bla regulator protein blaR1
MTYADLSPLANHLWQSTVFAGAVWSLALALRQNRAEVRYCLWLAASMKFLIPFSLLVSTGDQLGRRVAPAIEKPQWSFVAEEFSHPFTASAAVPPGVATPAFNPIPAILLGVWLCGVAVGIIFWLRSWRQMQAARRAATPIAMDLPIPVVSSLTRLEPGVFGIPEPVLLLPEGITDRLTPAQLAAIVTHEMCHVRRRDNLTAAIHMMVEVLFWFYPLIWWIRARLIEERERACDEEVLRSGGDASVYAEGILNVCRHYLESPLVCVSGIAGSDLRARIDSIMIQKIARNLTVAKKLLLAVGGIAAVAMPIAFGVLNAPASHAQSNGERPKFEVASVKPSKSEDRRPLFDIKPELFRVTNVTVSRLIQVAYGIEGCQVAGGPDWSGSDLFDITAKPQGLAKTDQINLMLQSLLADRFQLVIRRETKEMPVYALVVAKNGPKFKEADETAPNIIDLGEQRTPDATRRRPPVMRIRRGLLVAQEAVMPMLAFQLSNLLGRTVLDKTGLTGRYDLKLEWAPDESQVAMFQAMGVPEGAGAPLADSLGPSLFSALQEQLGLKLDAQKGPVEILVIESIERPSAN